MRIGIDARILGHKTSGIGVYAVNLVEQFLKFKDLQIVLFADRPVSEEYKYITDKVETVIFGEKSRKRWSQVYLPAQLKKYRVDVYHAVWNNAVPIFTSVPSVLTVHDIIPLVVPGYFKNLQRRYKYIFSMRSALSRAKIIIAVSNATKNDIVKYFNVPDNRIKVIYEGVSEYLIDAKAIRRDTILPEFGIKYDYIVNVGSFDRRRNAEALIRVFAAFIKRSGADCQLVLLGGYDDFTKEIIRFNDIIEESGLKGKVIFTNYVPQEEKIALLSGAKMMVHLSLYEGFCFPVLEAMQLGIPVIASNTGSMPEIAGNAAILVNPADEDEAVKAIEKLWNDKNLANDLVAKGHNRIKNFSWEKTARETIDLYEKVF